MSSSYNVCVVGAGRWGKNHIRTLSELGALGGVVESNYEVLNSLKKTYPEIQFFSDLESALEKLVNCNELKEAFGEKVINSYIKLRNNEIDNFNSKENFSKDKPITTWEKLNTLDC